MEFRGLANSGSGFFLLVCSSSAFQKVKTSRGWHFASFLSFLNRITIFTTFGGLISSLFAALAGVKEAGSLSCYVRRCWKRNVSRADPIPP
jgi:hypothetical protein